MSNESLQDLLLRFITKYPFAKQEPFAGHAFGNLVRNTIPTFLTNQIKNDRYIVKGSVGQGTWADVPWICIFNKNITTTATKGIYIAYLLAKGTDSLFLTLNQGCTDIRESHKKRETISIMRDRAKKITNNFDTHGFKSDENIFLGTGLTELAELYQKGTIFYKEYKKNNIPDDKVLLDDFNKILEIYEEVAANPQLYSPGFEHTKNTTNNLEKETTKMIAPNLNNIIYYGVPGTGKTFAMQWDYINNSGKKENTFSTTFHQSFSYEEFVEGLKAELTEDKTQVAYNVKSGIFFEACEKAAELAGYDNLQKLIEASESERKEKMQSAISADKIVYFCIDEINRGNVASIFGDLISLIETSKRLGAEYEMIVTLPYSKIKFGVPSNLKIIGTMNTADRSIQLLDSALRRRFTFVECAPKYDGDENVKYKNKKASEILKAINNRIRAYLGKDYQIGHAYLINCETDLDIFESLRDKIIPLLEEYFYGEIDKIRNILNERDENANNFYMEDESAEKAYKDMTGADDYEEKNFYVLSHKLLSVTSEEDASNFIEHIIK